MKALMMMIMLALICLSACGDVAGDPSDTVEQYLQAKISADRDTLAGLLCQSLESSLEREAGSFANVSARLDNMVCTREGDTNVVACTGAIIASYGREETNFPLGRYQVVLEDGEWRWCGETR